MDKWPLLTERARHLILTAVQTDGLCVIYGSSQDIYVHAPSDHAEHSIAKLSSAMDGKEVFRQARDFEAVCRKRRGVIIQALIDGFADWTPE